MSTATTYSHTGCNWHCHVLKWRTAIAVLLLIGLNSFSAFSQTDNSLVFTAFNHHTSADTSLEEQGEYYDEVTVTLNVPRIGSMEIQAIVIGNQLYLPVKELFDFLKIRNTVSPDFDLVEGFFIYPKDNYFIDKTNNRIVYRFKAFELNPRDLIRTETNLYLKSDYFGQIFGLECVFNFRSLSVIVNTKIELPAIREMQQELMRRNIGRLKGEIKADTIIPRSFPLFYLGMADWSVISTQATKGKSNTRANIGIGGIVAGGEMNLSLNYNSEMPIDLRQQFYQWRFVNNDYPAMRQMTAGKLYAQSISSIFAPIIGMQITNTPTTYRRSFGTYTLSNMTGPGWMVELYVNNVLVDYIKADASGFYTFEVPMVYGNSLVKLRFYGPWGEEQTSEKFITVPFNFIPLNQFEYNLTAGVVDNDDHQKSLFSRANFNYGLARYLTIGGGIEYLSSVTSGKTMPFINASISLSQHILVSGEHTPGVRSKGIIRYRRPSKLQVDFNYTRYEKGQTSVQVNHIEEKKIVLSMPLRGKKFTAFSRFTLNQFTFPYNPVTVPKTKNKYTSAEFLLSAVVSGVSSNLTTFAVISKPGNPLIYSNLSLTFRLPAGIRITPQAQYEYDRKNFSLIKAEIEKSIFNRGFLNASYEKSFVYDNISSMTVGFRYNFSFAQTFFSATKSRNTIATIQSARGSLLYDGKTNYIGVSNQTNVGKGGLIIQPFLDLNCNGRHEANEPRAFGLKLRINGGNKEHNTGDTTIRITNLEAYASYYIELEKNSFDNIAWQIKKPTLSVVVDPNSLKLVEVPVAVVGEASGKVSLNGNKGLNGLGRIIVNIYNSDSILVAHLLTESDGFFDFIGLAPGEYTASIDSAQLAKLQMTSSPALSFKISQNEEGDIVNNLEFTLYAAPENISPVIDNK